MSPTRAERGGSLTDLASAEDLPIEWLDAEGVTVAVESNPEQSLVFVESDEGSSVAIAVGREEVTLAEAIEAAREINRAVDRLATPVFATDGGGRHA